jgi:uncharacterized membrane protein
MGKYDKYNPQSRLGDKPWTIHPIWRGIGCLMMVIIPLVAFAVAVLLVDANSQQHWLVVPYQMSEDITIPFLGTIDNFYAVILVTVLLSLIGFGILTIIYSIIYSAFGPPRYGPVDSPPIRRSRRSGR